MALMSAGYCEKSRIQAELVMTRIRLEIAKKDGQMDDQGIRLTLCAVTSSKIS